MKEVSELLKPRVKVIADYPFSQFTVGEIIEVDKDEFLRSPRRTIIAKNYPHLFQSLPWYAEREASEMPEYVKSHNHYVQKVIKWEGRNHKDVPLFQFQNSINHPLTIGMANEWQPATAEEYETYINSLK